MACNADDVCYTTLSCVAQVHLSLFLALCLPLLLLLLHSLPPLRLFRVVKAIMMAPLKCCSFNCRGWNNGKLSLINFINSLDLCFIQEHWLLSDHLNDVCDISPDFLSVGVSGMNSDILSRGRPFGGCSILYRKSLSPYISPLYSCSDRFCGVRVCDSSGLSYLFVSVYMPTYYTPDSCYSYLNTLGELEGFITSHACDVNVIVGDFNVDFDRGGPLAKLLNDFILEFGLLACDLNFRPSVCYTYESDDSCTRSWLDHILCSQHISSLVTDIHTVRSASISSDHYPLFFQINISCSHSPCSLPVSSASQCVHIDWSRVSPVDIENYNHMVSCSICDLPSNVTGCVDSDCIQHHDILDSYALNFISSLHNCAVQCFPTYKPSSRRLAGWKVSAGNLKHSATFWYRIWNEAGCPSSGVLFQIKKHSKSRYKHEVCRLKRKQNRLLQDKLAGLSAQKNLKDFWSQIKKLNRSRSSSTSPVVDGLCDSKSIANRFATKFSGVLNTHSSVDHDNFHSFAQSSVNSCHLSEVSFSDVDVLEAISQLKPKKSDSDGICSEHLRYASSSVAKSLANFFTSVVRHGYMPHCLRDCVLTPIPKSGKDISSSQNYRAIALASSLSKVLEHLILKKYSSFLSTSHLQFGFKSGFSTTLCTGVLKNVVSRYIHRGSSVLGCFLDASKAFDLVNHGVLFCTLFDRGLPLSVLRFLSSWYETQKMSVRWSHSFSDPFSVSNGVRQGSVLSPVLFSVYLDELLEMLGNSGVGCHWGGSFVGALCYADDIVLLAPCASALRHMLNICDSFATSHGLVFNANKTQLICFRRCHTLSNIPTISFNDITLPFLKEVTHLGHILTYNLDDKPDIIRAVKEKSQLCFVQILCTGSFHQMLPNQDILPLTVWLLLVVSLLTINWRSHSTSY